MRRLLVIASLVLCECGSSHDASSNKDAGDGGYVPPPTPTEWDRAVTRPSDAQATTDRASCKFARGAMPAETLGESTPVDTGIPIETIVVLIQENHSFDNYFSKLNAYGARTDIEVAPAGASNPDKVVGGTTTVPFQHAEHLCTLDVDHSWNGTHLEWDNGKMDGFVQANETGTALGSGSRAMLHWNDTDLPFYYELANTFSIADHYHASVLGPTWPNRMYSYAATSFGRTSNAFADVSAYPFPDKDASVLDELEKRHVTWNLYAEGVPAAGMVYLANVVNRWTRSVVFHLPDFLAAAKGGTLPAVSYLDANLSVETSAAGDDEHPPGDIQVGQKWVSDVVHALFASPQWNHLALFIAYDEHGGYYDHVPPPAACPPGDFPAELASGDAPGDFGRYGIRVPFMVVSPYAKKGFVSHKTYDHSSIVRFIQAKFKLPALTGRDANADIPMDMFDFGNPSFATPPQIPEPSIDATQVQYCTATYP